MNPLLKLLLLLVLIGCNTAMAKNPRFHIKTSANNKETSAYLGYFETRIFNELKESFPCAEINSDSNVGELLEWEKQKQLLGVSNGEGFDNIAASIASDYLISLKVQMQGTNVVVSALCMYSRKVEALARAMATASHGGPGLDAVEKVSRQLIDDLKKFEICPFTGPVNIVISSFRDTTITEQYPVYCNESDETYKKEIKIHSSTESKWNLERKGIPWTEGTMSFSTFESNSVEEMNGCYKCPSGREGGRTFSQKSSFRINGSGISHQSMRNGRPQQDTRIELEFLDNGTYLIKPKGTSLPARGNEKTEISAQGTCDNISPESKTREKEVTIPLNVVFGPYPGNSSDKLLKQSDVKKTIDPVSGERSTVTIDFELKHD